MGKQVNPSHYTPVRCRIMERKWKKKGTDQLGSDLAELGHADGPLLQHGVVGPDGGRRTARVDRRWHQRRRR